MSKSTRTNLIPSDFTTEMAQIQLMIKSAMSGVRTSMPVQVVKVTNTGGLSPIGYVDLQPLVNLVDASGNAIKHAVVHNAPYMRIQGGANGIIIDPVVGDIGIALICDRDISTVKNTSGISAPGSNRKFDISDMVYLSTIIGQAPTQYIQFNSAGITIHSPTKVTISAPNVEIDGSSQIALNAPTIVLNGAIQQGSGSFAGNAVFGGSITATGDVTGNGTSLHSHKHGGVQTGSGQTGVPV